MTTIEWHDEMRRTVAPHIDEMKRELQGRWPGLDPEMVLLHWLCMKHNLEPPGAKIKRGAQGDGNEALQDLSPQPTPPGTASAPAPPGAGGAGSRLHASGAVKAKTRVGGLAPLPVIPAPPKSKGEAPDGAQTARSLDLGPGAPESTMLPPSGAFPPPPASARGPGGGGGDEQDPAWPPQPSPPRGPKPIRGLRTLGRLNVTIETDAQRHMVRAEHMENTRTHITDMVANMRQELRGQFLGKVPLLSRNVLSEQEQLSLVGKLRPWTFESGHKIIVEGEIGDKLYIIERGMCEVMKTINGREICVGQLTKGAFFGEIAVLYDMPRTATVRTTTAVTALSLARNDLMSTVGEQELESMRVIARTQVFSSIPLFSALNSDQKVRIAGALKKQKWRQNAILTGENHITSRLYIVEHGQLLMEVKNKELLPSFWPVGAQPVITLSPGGFFGMRGLLYGAPVGFNISAATDVQTLSISFEEVLETSPPEEREAMEATMRKAMQGYLLRQIPQLKQMAQEHFETVLEHVEEVHFKKWSVILAKGEHIKSVYVLEKGMVLEHDGEHGVMCELPGEVNGLPVGNSKPPRVTPGEFFGVGCLTDKTAKADYTLVALTDVTLLRLPPGVVWSVLHAERQHIAKIPLLSQEVLGKAEQYMLVGKLKPWNFPAGKFIIKEGEIGDMLYVIEKGVCDAIKEIDGKEVVVSQLKKGAFFGELAVMYDMPRTATVRATTDVVAVSLSREDIYSAVSPEKIQKMKCIACTQVFQQIPLLKTLETSVKIKIAEKLRSDEYKQGDKIQAEGEATHRFHIIEKGDVKLVRAGRELCKKHPGYTIGELGNMHKENAHFTCIAFSQEVKTLSISMEEILETAGTGERPALERKLASCFRRALIMQLPQMKGKSDEYISAVLNHAEPLNFLEGDTIFEQGRPLEAAYLLERGQLTVAEGDRECDPNLPEPERHYGAECLDAGGTGGSPAETRAEYTLQAATDCTVLRVPRAVAQLTIK